MELSQRIEAFYQKHGSHVYSVAMRITKNEEWAEQASKATFQVLAKKARSKQEFFDLDGTTVAWQAIREAMRIRRKKGFGGKLKIHSA